jgi:hypothetical protein
METRLYQGAEAVYQQIAVCEFVRIQSSDGPVWAHLCPRSVRTVRVRSHEFRFRNCLRGWRSQDRVGSNPIFRTTS